MVGVNDKAQENCIQNRLNASNNLATCDVCSATEEFCHSKFPLFVLEMAAAIAWSAWAAWVGLRGFTGR